MNREFVLIVGGGIVAAAVLLALSLPEIDFPERTESPEDYEGWNTSGPFSFNKFQYKIGENVFFSVHGLKENEAGKIQVIPPNGEKIFQSIPFDGAKKSSFNQYFKPTTNRPLKICEVNDLVGEWLVVFEGAPYPPIKFEIIDEWIPGSQAEIDEKVC